MASATKGLKRGKKRQHTNSEEEENNDDGGIGAVHVGEDSLAAPFAASASTIEQDIKGISLGAKHSRRRLYAEEMNIVGGDGEDKHNVGQRKTAKAAKAKAGETIKDARKLHQVHEEEATVADEPENETEQDMQQALLSEENGEGVEEEGREEDIEEDESEEGRAKGNEWKAEEIGGDMEALEESDQGEGMEEKESLISEENRQEEEEQEEEEREGEVGGNESEGTRQSMVLLPRWTKEEVDAFHFALCRYGARDMEALARAVGKSIFDVWVMKGRLAMTATDNHTTLAAKGQRVEHIYISNVYSCILRTYTHNLIPADALTKEKHPSILGARFFPEVCCLSIYI